MVSKKVKPDKREFTLMLVPHYGKKDICSIKIPIKAIEIAVGSLCLLVLVLIGTFINYGHTINVASADKQELEYLRQVNGTQKQKLEKLAQETAVLQEDMKRVNQLEADVRKMVNSDDLTSTSRSGPVRPAVVRDGKGGPVTVTDIDKMSSVVNELRSSAQSREQGLKTVYEDLVAKQERDAATPSIWPTDGDITSRFGWRASPFGWGSDYHPGIDIANDTGTPIAATANGIVVQSGWYSGYGKAVLIDHGNGIVTVYGHNSQLNVEAGQRVKKGEIISYMGSTGMSTGSHLHYEVRVNGTAVNPSSFLNM